MEEKVASPELPPATQADSHLAVPDDYLDPRLTERRNPRSATIDTASALEIVDLIGAEDATVPAAVARAREEIARAIDLIEAAFRAGGRLLYVGAGTSGRLGVLDAAECPPTFGTPPEMVVGVIAGGLPALVQVGRGRRGRRERRHRRDGRPPGRPQRRGRRHRRERHHPLRAGGAVPRPDARRPHRPGLLLGAARACCARPATSASPCRSAPRSSPAPPG